MRPRRAAGDTRHLHATLFRADLRRDILTVLESDASTANWRRQFGALDLRSLLLRLFPFASSASAADQQQHFICLHCGAFTARQANTAAKSLGFASAEDGRLTLQQIRLVCLDRVAHIFRGLKEAAAP